MADETAQQKTETPVENKVILAQFEFSFYVLVFDFTVGIFMHGEFFD